MEAIILAAIVTLILMKICEAPAQPQPQGQAWPFWLNLLAVALMFVFGSVMAIFIYGWQP